MAVFYLKNVSSTTNVSGDEHGDRDGISSIHFTSTKF